LTKIQLIFKNESFYALELAKTTLWIVWPFYEPKICARKWPTPSATPLICQSVAMSAGSYWKIWQGEILAAKREENSADAQPGLRRPARQSSWRQFDGRRVEGRAWTSFVRSSSQSRLWTERQQEPVRASIAAKSEKHSERSKLRRGFPCFVLGCL